MAGLNSAGRAILCMSKVWDCVWYELDVRVRENATRVLFAFYILYNLTTNNYQNFKQIKYNLPDPDHPFWPVRGYFLAVSTPRGISTCVRPSLKGKGLCRCVHTRRFFVACWTQRVGHLRLYRQIVSGTLYGKAIKMTIVLQKVHN